MLIQKLEAHSKQTPSKTALVYNGIPISYLKFHLTIIRIINDWKTYSLPSNTVAVVYVKNIIDTWTATIALQSLGLITICITKLADIDELKISNISCIVICQFNLKEVKNTSTNFIAIKKIDYPDGIYAEKIIRNIQYNLDTTNCGGHILYTSGTTGKFKKLKYDNKNDGESIELLSKISKITANTVWNITNFGLWTAAGYRRPRTVWSQGGTVVMDQRANYLEHLGDFKVTNVNFVPRLVMEAIQKYKELKIQKNNFMLHIGGGPISFQLILDIRKYITENIEFNYGCTELLSQPMKTIIHCKDDLSWLKPNINRNIEIVNELDEHLENGKEGFIRIKLLPLDSTEYYEDTKTTSKIFKHGYFYPGDIGIMRDDGRIKVLGRSADVINIGGNKIATREIEESLEKIFDTHAACVFSAQDENSDQIIIFSLEGVKAIMPIQISQMNRMMGKYNTIVKVVQIPKFPRTTNGMLKIDRSKIKEVIASTQEGKNWKII